MTGDRMGEQQRAVEAIAAVLGREGVSFSSRAPIYRSQLQRFVVQVAEALLDSGVVVPKAELEEAREELRGWQESAMEHDDAIALAQQVEDRKWRIIGLQEERDAQLARAVRAEARLAAAERAREEAQRERDELLRQRAEFDTPMQRAAEEAHERAERLGEALDELVRLKDGPRDDAYRAAKDAAWDRARAALARESSPTDACTCGNGEAEEDRGAVLRCPVHGIASSPTEGECS